MEGTFKIGEVVKLRSGGPWMTVREIFSNGNLKTNWFDGGLLKDAYFEVQTLQSANADNRSREA